MKCKTMKHGSIGLQCMMLAFVFAVCFTGCKDSKDETSAPYDPNQPVKEVRVSNLPVSTIWLPYQRRRALCLPS